MGVLEAMVGEIGLKDFCRGIAGLSLVAVGGVVGVDGVECGGCVVGMFM